MPPFRRVGAVLKERFDGATEVGAWGGRGAVTSDDMLTLL